MYGTSGHLNELDVFLVPNSLTICFQPLKLGHLSQGGSGLESCPGYCWFFGHQTTTALCPTLNCVFKVVVNFELWQWGCECPQSQLILWLPAYQALCSHTQLLLHISRSKTPLVVNFELWQQESVSAHNPNWFLATTLPQPCVPHSITIDIQRLIVVNFWTLRLVRWREGTVECGVVLTGM